MGESGRISKGAMRVRLTYYGQKERDFDLCIGDLISWVATDGAFGRGLIVGFIDEPNKDLVLVLLVDGALKKITKGRFFRLRVDNRDSSPGEWQ